jgi:nucleotide-binding universal stress UspA family protein
VWRAAYREDTMADPSSLFTNILVPVDGSASSIAAGRLAVRLAKAAAARLTFLYVVDQTVVDELARASARDAALVEEDLAATGRRNLDLLSRTAKENGLEAGRELRRGEPEVEITRWATDQNADLIVIGQVGRRGLQRILIGSVTERVIEHSGCPVLVVH